MMTKASWLLGLMTHLRIGALLGVALGVFGSMSAKADEFICDHVVGAVSIDANVTVPEDADCTFNGTTVDGNLSIESDANFLGIGATINGNVEANEAESVGFVVVTEDGVCLGASTIKGNLEANGVKGVFRPPAFFVSNTFIVTVHGNVRVSDSGGSTFMASADVHGNVEFTDNLGTLTVGGTDGVAANGTPLTFGGVGIDGNLECSGNGLVIAGCTGDGIHGENVISGNVDEECAPVLDGPSPLAVAFGLCDLWDPPAACPNVTE